MIRKERTILCRFPYKNEKPHEEGASLVILVWKTQILMTSALSDIAWRPHYSP